jgi:hypothetical protein
VGGTGIGKCIYISLWLTLIYLMQVYHAIFSATLKIYMEGNLITNLLKIINGCASAVILLLLFHLLPVPHHRIRELQIFGEHYCNKENETFTQQHG